MTVRATVVCDSINEAHARLTTVEVHGLLLVPYLITAPAALFAELTDPRFNFLHAALERSRPRLRSADDWHLPYIDSDVVEDIILHVLSAGPDTGVELTELDEVAQSLAIRVSAARCARMSWASVSVAADLAACDAGYFIHQAQPYPGCPHGWKQYAVMFSEEKLAA